MLVNIWTNRSLTLALWVAVGILTFYRFFVYEAPQPTKIEVEERLTSSSSKIPLLSNLGLNEHQCATTFPGLFTEVDRMVARRNGTKLSVHDLNNVDAHGYGTNRLIVMNNKLYIVTHNDGTNSRQLASMNSLVQALVSSPVLLPDVEFVWDIQDKVNDDMHIWAFSYNEKNPRGNIWLMPDFGHWSWPEPKVGAFHEVQRNAKKVNEMYMSETVSSGQEYTMQTKQKKLLWRGAIMEKPERESLVSETEGREWADVAPLDWNNSTALSKTLMTMSDHCHSAYLAHVEGHSYSGRLKYLLLCHSVIVTHNLKYRQHFSPMLLSDGPAQNHVKVRDDFSDLQDAMTWLLDHPTEADAIATRGRKMAEMYLSEAAIACYWRRLITAWASVSDYKPVMNGVPWESFTLTRSLIWEAH